MPIHFRCAHCEKLLGIARRKAGSIVNCPQCEQPLIVPTPEPGEVSSTGLQHGAYSSLRWPSHRRPPP